MEERIKGRGRRRDKIRREEGKEGGRRDKGRREETGKGEFRPTWKP